jgi:YidC/Oxa1 family membrane protein insertase
LLVILVAWWFFYQKPLLEGQKIAQTQPVQETTNTQPQNKKVDDNEQKIQDVLKDSSADTINQKTEKAIEDNFANSYLAGSINLKGLKINNASLAKYKDKNNNGNNILLLSDFIHNNGKNFVDFGWIVENQNNGANSPSVPNENSQWSFASENEISNLKSIIQNKIKIDSNSSQDIIYTNDNISTINKALDKSANRSIFKWSGQDDVTFYVIFYKPQDNNPYLLKFDTIILNNSNKDLTVSNYSRINREVQMDEVKSSSIVDQGFIGYFNGSLNELEYDDIEKTKQQIFSIQNDDKKSNQQSSWIGITQKYWFTGVYTPLQIKTVRFLKENGSENNFQADYITRPYTIKSNDITIMPLEFFVGAKEIKTISTDHYKKYQLFDRVINFGVFYILTKPILLLLNIINGFVNNYGYAIIILTIIVKALLLPLSFKSFHSMAKIKRLAPMVEEIRKTNLKDKRQMHLEVAALYRSEKVNPISGILPILIQMPIFFALYKVLFISIELRHAHFIFWLNDLSARDTSSVFNMFGLIPFAVPSFLMIGVLPILTGFTMWIQQLITPKTPNPMMDSSVIKWIPVIFTVLFASFPSGLLLYWITSNIFSILQQLFFDIFITNRMDKKTSK